MEWYTWASQKGLLKGMRVRLPSPAHRERGKMPNKKVKDVPKKKVKVDPDQFFTRVLHRAYMRDGDLVHTGEALTLALLLHAHGKQRTKKDIEEVAKLLDDPNL